MTPAERQAILEKAKKKFNIQTTETKKALATEDKQKIYTNLAKQNAEKTNTYATKVNDYFNSLGSDEYKTATERLKTGDTSGIKSYAETGQSLLKEYDSYAGQFDEQAYTKTKQALEGSVSALNNTLSSTDYISQYNALLDTFSNNAQIVTDTLNGGFNSVKTADFSSLPTVQDEASKLLEQIGDTIIYDEDTTNKLKSGLSQIVEQGNALNDYAKGATDYYSQFETEDEATKFEEYTKQASDMSTDGLLSAARALQKELKEREDQIVEWYSVGTSEAAEKLPQYRKDTLSKQYQLDVLNATIQSRELSQLDAEDIVKMADKYKSEVQGLSNSKALLESQLTSLEKVLRYSGDKTPENIAKLQERKVDLENQIASVQEEIDIAQQELDRYSGYAAAKETSYAVSKMSEEEKKAFYTVAAYYYDKGLNSSFTYYNGLGFPIKPSTDKSDINSEIVTSIELEANPFSGVSYGENYKNYTKEEYNQALQLLKEKGYNADVLDKYAKTTADESVGTLFNNAIAEMAKKSPVASSIASVSTNVTSGLGYVDLATQNIERISSGNSYLPLNTNTALMQGSNATNTIRSTVSNQLDDWKAGSANIASKAYQAVMSALDSTINAAATTGFSAAFKLTGAARTAFSSAFTSAIMGSQAATSQTVNALNQGYEPTAALTYGFLYGGVEALTESLGIEAMFKAWSSPDASVLKNAIAAMSSEGAEEVAANWLDRAVDRVYNGNQGAFKVAYEKYIADGLSAEEATTKAIMGILSDDVTAFASGAFAASMSAPFIASYVNTIKETTAEKRTQKQINYGFGSLALENDLMEKLSEKASVLNLDGVSEMSNAQTAGNKLSEVASKMYPDLDNSRASVLLYAELYASKSTSVQQINDVISSLVETVNEQTGSNEKAAITKLITSINKSKAQTLYENSKKTDIEYLKTLSEVNDLAETNTQAALNLIKESIQSYGETGREILKGGYSVDNLTEKINKLKLTYRQIATGKYDVEQATATVNMELEKAQAANYMAAGKTIANSLSPSTLSAVSQYVKTKDSTLGELFNDTESLQTFAQDNPVLAQKTYNQLREKGNPAAGALSRYINRVQGIQKSINELFGIEVKDLGNSNGEINLSNGKIVLNSRLGSEMLVSFVLGHEVFHAASRVNPEAVNAITAFMKNQNEDSYNQQLKFKADKYLEKLSETKTAEEADSLIKANDYLYIREEIAADFLGRVVARNEEAFVNALKKTKPLLVRALETVNKFLRNENLSVFLEESTVQKYERLNKAIEKVLKDTYQIDFQTAKGETTNEETKHSIGEITDSDGNTLMPEQAEFSEESTRYSLREEAPPTKTQDVYKLMRLVDGKLYPLFVDSANPVEVGKWYNADSPNMDFLKTMPSGVFLVDTEKESYQSLADYCEENGKKMSKYPSKVDVNKATEEGKRWVYIEDTAKRQKRFEGETRKYWNIGINGSGTVSTFSMRPGWHAGSLPSMRQIGKGANGTLRDDAFVWTVGKIPADIDYQTEANGNPDKDIPTHIPVDGYYLKATNADKAKSQADVIGWYVAGAFKIDRIISDAEARKAIDDWNASHPKAKAEYDYDRESGMDFDADKMKLIPKSGILNQDRSGIDIRYSLSDYIISDSMTNQQIAKQIKEQGLTATLEALADSTESLVSRDNPGELFADTARFAYNGFTDTQAKALLAYEIDGLNATTIGKLKQVNDNLLAYAKTQDEDFRSAASDLINRLKSGESLSIAVMNSRDFIYDMTEVVLKLSRGDIEQAKTVLSDVKNDYLTTLKFVNGEATTEIQRRLTAISETEKAIAEGKITEERANTMITANPFMNEVIQTYNRRLKTAEKLKEKTDVYGAKEKGEIPARSVEMPEQTSQDTKTQRFVRTVAEAESVSEQQALALEDMVASGKFNYHVFSDKKAISKARIYISENGIEGALQSWNQMIKDNTFPDKSDIAKAELLIVEYASRRDAKTVVSIVAELSAVATKMGQNIQALHLLKRASGAVQLQYLNRIIAYQQESINNRHKDNTKSREKRLRKEELEKRLSGMEQEKAEAQEQVDTLQGIIDTNREIDDLTKSLASAETTRDIAQSELDGLVSAVYILHEQLKIMSEEISVLQERIASAQAKLATAVSEYNAVKTAYENAINKRKELTDNLRKTKAKIKSDTQKEYVEWWKTELLYQEMEGAQKDLEKAENKLNGATEIRDEIKKISEWLKHKGYVDIVVPDYLKEMLAQEDLTPADRQTVLDEIYKVVASQIPATLMDKWNNWRYFAMLANPLTHVRNTVGNVLFMPSVLLKDVMATGMEHMFLKEDERTKQFKGMSKYKSFADMDFENVENLLHSGGKYNPSSVINAQRTIFKWSGLEKARLKNFELLELEDALFLRFYYKHSLKMYLAAHDKTISKLTNGKKLSESASIEPGGELFNLLDEARAYAIREAQKNTYRDRSKVAEELHKASETGTLLQTVLVEGLIPFKKTPMNLLARSVEYTPIIGAIKAFSDAAQLAKEGKRYDANELINGLASSMSGTTLFMLGTVLRALGVITGAGDDDEEKSAWDKLTGTQAYSVTIGNKNYTIGWAVPISLPLFVGAAFYDLTENFWCGLAGKETTGNEQPSVFTALVNAFSSLVEPMVQLSMLSGLVGALDAYESTDAEKISGILISTIASYFSQGVPSFGGALTRMIYPEMKRTYINKNGILPTSFQYIVQAQAKKIPMLAFLLEPYVDEWGRTESYKDENGNVSWVKVDERIAANLVSPGYFDTTKISNMEKELERLYDATSDSTVFPNTAAKKISANGETYYLTAKQYTAYAKEKGSLAFDKLTQLTGSGYYSGLNDAERVEAIESVYDLTNAISSQNALKSMGVKSDLPAKWMENIKNFTENDQIGFIVYQSIVNSENALDHSLSDARQKAISNTNLSETVWLATLSESAAADYTTQKDAYGKTPKDYGVSIETYVLVYDFKSNAKSDRDAFGKEIKPAYAKVIEYIDSQPITDIQKISLYVTWYSASELRSRCPRTWFDWK